MAKRYGYVCTYFVGFHMIFNEVRIRKQRNKPTYHKMQVNSPKIVHRCLKIFLAVAYMLETKGLSCLNFLEFQPLEKIVAYI